MQLLTSCIEAGGDRSTDTAAPTLGQHTDEILQSLGYDASDIEKLRESKTV